MSDVRAHMRCVMVDNAITDRLRAASEQCWATPKPSRWQRFLRFWNLPGGRDDLDHHEFVQRCLDGPIARFTREHQQHTEQCRARYLREAS